MLVHFACSSIADTSANIVFRPILAVGSAGIKFELIVIKPAVNEWVAPAVRRDVGYADIRPPPLRRFGQSRGCTRKACNPWPVVGYVHSVETYLYTGRPRQRVEITANCPRNPR